MSQTTPEALNATSSIGAVWPPAHSSAERLRGFYDEGIVATRQDCATFAEHFREQQAELTEQPELTRLSIRLVTFAGRLSVLETMGIRVEAAIPLAGTEPGMVVAYAAANAPQREVPAATLHAHGGLLRAVVREHTVGKAQVPPGYEPRVIDRQTTNAERTRLEEQFLGMYGIFGYDRTDVREILHSPTNTIAYLESDGRVVSTAMAERASIPVAGLGRVELVEITEASTHPAYRQRGLYKAVSAELVRHILARQGTDPVHAIYGESNLAMPGVLIAAQENGRRFSYFDSDRFGLRGTDGFGILRQNMHIADGTERRPYNDFAVSYLPLQSTGEAV